MRVGAVGNRKRIGQFGNHLFQFHLLHQISRQLKLEYFQTEWRELIEFQNTTQKSLSRVDQYFRTELLPAGQVKEMSYLELKDRIRTVCESEKNVEIPPGILGERFLESCEISPRDIIRFKNNSAYKNESQKFIALHFRGGDFSEWDQNAILKPDYYLNALDEILSKSLEKDCVIQLFTDDVEHSTVREIKRIRPNIEIISGSRNNDFRRMTNSDVLIASPSTFAFWASILGKQKKIVMSREWLEYATNEGQKFWIDLRSNKNHYAKIDLEI